MYVDRVRLQFIYYFIISFIRIVREPSGSFLDRTVKAYELAKCPLWKYNNKRHARRLYPTLYIINRPKCFAFYPKLNIWIQTKIIIYGMTPQMKGDGGTAARRDPFLKICVTQIVLTKRKRDHYILIAVWGYWGLDCTPCHLARFCLLWNSSIAFVFCFFFIRTHLEQNANSVHVQKPQLVRVDFWCEHKIEKKRTKYYTKKDYTYPCKWNIRIRIYVVPITLYGKTDYLAFLAAYNLIAY